MSCGFEYHAYSDAANNVLARGHRVLAFGKTVLLDSVKQEPEKQQGALNFGCIAAWWNPTYSAKRLVAGGCQYHINYVFISIIKSGDSNN